MNQSAPIRIGVAGLGSVAQAVHLPLIARRPDLFTVAGFCDVSRETLDLVGDRYGVEKPNRFVDLDEMLDTGDVDALFVLTKGSHADPVLAGFDRGIPVFCEKPLVCTVAEADELDARKPALDGPPLLLAYMKQYDPAVRHAVRLLEDVDEIRNIDVTVLHPTGASQLAFARVLRPSAPPPPDAVERHEAADRRLRNAAVGETDPGLWSAYRSCLIGSLSHDLSILRSFDVELGTVDYADIFRPGATPAHLDDSDDQGFGSPSPSITAVGTLAGGGRYALNWHYLPDFPAYRETVRVAHNRGSIELTFPSPYLMQAPTQLTVTSKTGDAETRSTHRSITEAFENQLEAFHAMVRSGAEPLSDIAGGRTDIVDCQRVVAAYASRANVPIGGEIGRLVEAGTR